MWLLVIGFVLAFAAGLLGVREGDRACDHETGTGGGAGIDTGGGDPGAGTEPVGTGGAGGINGAG